MLRLIKTVYHYHDRNNQLWLVYKESLPKRKGTYTYWLASCPEAKLEQRLDNKRSCIQYIILLANITHSQPSKTT